MTTRREVESKRDELAARLREIADNIDTGSLSYPVRSAKSDLEEIGGAIDALIGEEEEVW